MMELTTYLTKLADEDETERLYAAEDLGYSNSPEAVPSLVNRLPVERSRAVQNVIFGALGRIDDDSVVNAALTLLQSEDGYLRNQAVGLLRQRCQQAIPQLKSWFSNGDHDQRKFVLDVLMSLEAEGADEIYDRAVADSDINVAITAIESVGNLRKTQFRERVEGMVTREAHPMLLGVCLEALSSIGNTQSLAVVRERLSGEEGMPALFDGPYAKLMGAFGTPADYAELARLIRSGKPSSAVVDAICQVHTRWPDAELPEALRVSLLEAARQRQASPAGCSCAVKMLAGFARYPDIFSFLSECLEHADKETRIAAAESLRQVHTEQAEQLIERRRVSEKDEEVLEALGATGHLT